MKVAKGVWRRVLKEKNEGSKKGVKKRFQGGE